MQSLLIFLLSVSLLAGIIGFFVQLPTIKLTDSKKAGCMAIGSFLVLMVLVSDNGRYWLLQSSFLLMIFAGIISLIYPVSKLAITSRKIAGAVVMGGIVLTFANNALFERLGTEYVIFYKAANIKKAQAEAERVRREEIAKEEKFKTENPEEYARQQAEKEAKKIELARQEAEKAKDAEKKKQEEAKQRELISHPAEMKILSLAPSYNVLLLYANIKNKADFAIKDLIIECRLYSASGTELSHVSNTVYQVIKPKKTIELRRFNMGWIHSQAGNGNCEITNYLRAE